MPLFLTRPQNGGVSNDCSWIHWMLAERRGSHYAAAGLADRIDLLDETDRAAFLTRGLLEGAEESADLPGRHPEPHRLECRGGDEEEGNSGFCRHGFCEVGLSGSRLPLEQDAPAGVPPQLLAEGPVRQEDLEGAGHLLEDEVDAAHVVEPEPDLLGRETNVGRAPVDEGHGQHEPEHDEDEHREQPYPRIRPEVGPPEMQRSALERASYEVDQDEDVQIKQVAKSLSAVALADLFDVVPMHLGHVAKALGHPRKVRRPGRPILFHPPSPSPPLEDSSTSSPVGTPDLYVDSSNSRDGSARPR